MHMANTLSHCSSLQSVRVHFSHQLYFFSINYKLYKLARKPVLRMVVISTMYVLSWECEKSMCQYIAFKNWPTVVTKQNGPLSQIAYKELLPPFPMAQVKTFLGVQNLPLVVIEGHTNSSRSVLPCGRTSGTPNDRQTTL